MVARRRRKRDSAPKMAWALVPPIRVQIVVERPSSFEASSGRMAASQLPLSADPDPVQSRTRPFGSIKMDPVPAPVAAA